MKKITALVLFLTMLLLLKPAVFSHAEEMQNIISQYFMTQRLKLADQSEPEASKALMAKLAMCHEILVYAMKTKQSTDIENISKLKEAVQNFKASYLKKHKH